MLNEIEKERNNLRSTAPHIFLSSLSDQQPGRSGDLLFAFVA